MDYPTRDWPARRPVAPAVAIPLLRTRKSPSPRSADRLQPSTVTEALRSRTKSFTRSDAVRGHGLFAGPRCRSEAQGYADLKGLNGTERWVYA